MGVSTMLETEECLVCIGINFGLYCSMSTCPTCRETTQQHGYDLALRRQALELYVDGMNFRRIARHLTSVMSSQPLPS